MRIFTIIFTFLFLLGGLKTQGQTALEKAMEKMNVSMKLPSFLDVSQNDDIMHVTPITEEDSLPSLAQIYLFEPSYGATAFKAYFGMVHSIIRYKDEDCIIFVLASGEYLIMPDDSDDLYKQKKKNRLAHRYGKRLATLSDKEIEEISLGVTHYQKEEVRKLFNADEMQWYPFDLHGNVFEDKYTKCIDVDVTKNGLRISFYFMLTDESEKKFDQYLHSLEKVFWFNE
jgi:hypothetical protein